MVGGRWWRLARPEELESLRAGRPAARGRLLVSTAVTVVACAPLLACNAKGGWTKLESAATGHTGAVPTGDTGAPPGDTGAGDTGAADSAADTGAGG